MVQFGFSLVLRLLLMVDGNRLQHIEVEDNGIS